MYGLTDSPVLQQQACATSCVPTSIAIALGVPVQDILDKLHELGVSYSSGLDHLETKYLLVSLGIGDLLIPHMDISVLDGHYLVGVPSLNKMGSLHCVFVHVYNGIATVYDPNTGKDGKESYLYWDTISMISFTKLYDFREYKP
jgi:hypothetical protein